MTTKATNCVQLAEQNPMTIQAGQHFWKVEAKCPFCHEHIEYKIISKDTPQWLGMGCTKCNRRIRIDA